MTNLIQLIDPDLVVSNTCVNLLPAAAAKTIGIPVIWILNEIIRDQGYVSCAIDVIHRFSDWIVGISRETICFFQEEEHAMKTLLLHPSFREEELEAHLWNEYRLRKRVELGVADGCPLVGFIASDLVPPKGVDHFVYMAIHLSGLYPYAQFVVVGNPTDRSYLHEIDKLIHDKGLAHRIRIVPFEKQLYHIVPALDIQIVPSIINEGFGMTAMEGMAYGKPVVAYRSGGLQEIMQSTGNGHFLVEKGDVMGLADKVHQLLVDGSLRRSVGEHNLAAVRAAFGMEVYRQKYRQLLETVKQKVIERRINLQTVRQKIPSGILVKGLSSQTVYLLEQGRKRPILTFSAFQYFHYAWEEVILLSDRELAAFPTGKAISEWSPLPDFPSGILLKGSGPALYLYEDGSLRAIADVFVFMRLCFDPAQIIQLPDHCFYGMPMGRMVDNEALRSGSPVNGRVYLAPDGAWYYGDRHLLRPIHGLEAWNFYKWRMDKAVIMTEADMMQASIGPPILL